MTNATTRLGACGTVLATLLTGCGGIQSMMLPSGQGAAGALRLWWVLFVVSGFVFFTVVGVLVAALFRRVPRDQKIAEDERTLRRAMSIGVGITTILLLVVTVATLLISVESFQQGDAKAPVTVSVAGELWWWRVTYLDEKGERAFETANELHMPVGTPVKVRLNSDNVIHSFWVPRLHGKVDMIPGQTNTIWLQADSEGVYRGQCAEFCGLQHTIMAFYVIVESPAEYQRWVARQREPASGPVIPARRRSDPPERAAELLPDALSPRVGEPASSDLEAIR